MNYFRGLLSEDEEKQVEKAFYGMSHKGVMNGCTEHILILENKTGETIGAIVFNQYPKIYALKVNNAYCKKGYGKLLVSAVAKFGAQLDRKAVGTVATQASLNFWKHLDFASDGSKMPLRCNAVPVECQAIQPLIEHFDEHTDCFDADYLDLLNQIQKDNFLHLAGTLPDATNSIYKKYFFEDLIQPPLEEQLNNYTSLWNRFIAWIKSFFPFELASKKQTLPMILKKNYKV